MNNTKKFLVLVQYRDDSKYNDFIGKFYHFPGGGNKNYKNFFSELPIEFLYYEPDKNGKGEYFGWGKINSAPFEDKKEPDHFYVAISEYKPLSKPIYYKNDMGDVIEKLYSNNTFNAQNSVRYTTKEFVDDICLDGGITLNFKADSHLMKVLGEELIATEKVGILELIKNAYDAQATYCKIRVEKIEDLVQLPDEVYQYPELKGPVIIIEDDGSGMDRNAIENGWLRPASTMKTNIKERIKNERDKAIKNGNLGVYDSLIMNLKKENNNRLPLGEKGVGRFATRRLGSKLIVKTKTKSIDYEYILSIDWDNFDQINKDSYTDLDKIGVSLSKAKVSRDYGLANSGTQLIIFGGRPGFSFDKNLLLDLNKTILQLKSPFKAPTGFDVSLECPQFPTLDRKLIYEEFDPVFTFAGIVNNTGICDFELNFTPPRNVALPKEKISDNSYDLRSQKKSYWKVDEEKLREPVCGQFYVYLNVWYRSKPWIEGPNEKDFHTYLDQHGGISIFRDGLNVFSSELGAKLDWLELSTRHIKVGSRISYYNFIGSIELEQEHNINLIDKTNREGLLNNQAFNDLSKLVQSIIFYIEQHFKSKRDIYHSLSGDILKEPKQIGGITSQASGILDKIIENYDFNVDSYKLLETYGNSESAKGSVINLRASLKKLEKSLKAMQHIQDLLAEQAGYGIAVAVSVHEIAKLTSQFYDKVLIIANGGKLSYAQQDELKISLESLRTELSKLSPLRAIRNEKKIEFDVAKSIKFVKDVFSRKLNSKGIKLIISGDSGFQVWARYGALNQVFANLIDNSIYWLDSCDPQKRVIQIDINSNYRSVIVADNNGDFDPVILPNVFEPGYSLREPASGLGLYICKYYMFDMKGNIYLAPSRDRINGLSGAQIMLDFSKVPSNNERE